MDERKLEKLALAGIQLIPADLDTHFIFERDGYVALVEKRNDDFGGVGAAGLLTERGLAPLVWTDSGAYFTVRQYRSPASEQQIAVLRRFQDDLEAALR